MKALSVRQPWAGLIVLGCKDIENRSWRTRHRGEMAIHAGRAVDGIMWSRLRYAKTVRNLRPNLYEPVHRVVDAHGFFDWEAHPAFTTGAVVGTVSIHDCTHQPASREDADREVWGHEGAYWWRFAAGTARAFCEPEPWRGQLGLFDLPDGIADRPYFGAVPRESTA